MSVRSNVSLRQVAIEFDPDGHTYLVDGAPVPSVTQIISECGLSDFSMVPEHVLEYACALGTATHKAAELYEIGTLDESTVDGPVKPRLDSWIEALKYLKDKGYENPVIEKPLYSPIGFCGTPDRMCYNGKELLVVDIKTGAKVKAAQIQTSGYGILGKVQVPSIRKIRRVCIYLKDDGFTPVWHESPSDENIFRSCLNVYNFKKGKG